MTINRLATLFLVVAVGLSATFLLPKSAAQPFGVVMSLPATAGDWWGKDDTISDQEKNVLGVNSTNGTEMARKRYTNHFLPTLPSFSLVVSMVLSGHDMSNSIHRPERCMEAQGYTILGSEGLSLQVDGRGTFPVTRLHNRKSIRDAAGKEILDENNQARAVEAYTYYWFVGEHTLTSSHFGRVFADNRDRLVRGVNQRWAFITITGQVPPQRTEDQQAKARKVVDETLQGFIKDLVPHIHKDGLKYD